MACNVIHVGVDTRIDSGSRDTRLCDGVTVYLPLAQVRPAGLQSCYDDGAPAGSAIGSAL